MTHHPAPLPAIASIPTAVSATAIAAAVAAHKDGRIPAAIACARLRAGLATDCKQAGNGRAGDEDNGDPEEYLAQIAPRRPWTALKVFKDE